jgi:hypothetical protein
MRRLLIPTTSNNNKQQHTIATRAIASTQATATAQARVTRAKTLMRNANALKETTSEIEEGAVATRRVTTTSKRITCRSMHKFQLKETNSTVQAKDVKGV